MADDKGNGVVVVDVPAAGFGDVLRIGLGDIDGRSWGLSRGGSEVVEEGGGGEGVIRMRGDATLTSLDKCAF